jgi:uncharacterized protein GlcG (DUF336 family)
MKSEVAQRMLEACRAKATEMGKAVSIAIVDSGGFMVAFERFNNPPAFTSVVAEGKANASAIMGRDSVNLAQMAQNAPAIINALGARFNGRFAPHQGAVVVRDAGGIVGAIGVSGATSEEDEQIAKAGAEKFSG